MIERSILFSLATAIFFLLSPIRPVAGDSMIPAAAPAAAAERFAAPGVVEPFSRERELAATVPGVIDFLGAKEGDPVKAGQIIAEIDNADLKAQLEAAKARLAVRQSELERLQNGAREEERREAAAALAEAEVAVRLARTTLERRASLARSGVASQISLDQAHADLDEALARRELMAERQALVLAPPRPEDVAIATANVQLATADIATLAAQIEKTRLRAPCDGVLLRLYKALGETVSVLPPTPIAKVGDISRLRVKADVDAADVARVARGQQAFVTADAYGSRRFAGVVARVGVELEAKRIRTDAATERLDTKVLPVFIDLAPPVSLPIGLRVDVFFAPPGTVVGAGDAPRLAAKQ